MRNLEVFKFGGVAVGTIPYIESALNICAGHGGPLVVVVSAMSGMTDRLIQSVDDALTTNLSTCAVVCQEFKKRHFEVIEQFVKEPEQRQNLRKRVEDACRELTSICESLAILQEKTSRILDIAVSRGERLSAEIFAASLSSKGKKAVFVDAVQLISAKVQDFGVEPDFDKCRAMTTTKLSPLLKEGNIILVPGFIGANEEGKLITLGRGGTDYSATILANVLNAKQVTLYKEVDGLLTSDPKKVPLARVIDDLHYREASELAYYGAKVLHPRSIAPLVHQEITLVIKNCMHPEFPGTRISGNPANSGFPVKALTAMHNQSLVAIEGKGMMGVPGVAARSFLAVAQSGISVSMISQASSENNICFVVPSNQASSAVECLQEAFDRELSGGLIDRIVAKDNIAIVAIVGLGMRGSPGIAARTFAAVSRVEANIIAIAQGSSELNISFAIDGNDVDSVLNALHHEYQLERMQVIPDRKQGNLGAVVFGLGQIGQTLVEQILEQRNFFEESLQVELQCSAVADRKAFVLQSNGFDAPSLNALVEHKRAKKSLLEYQVGSAGELATNDSIENAKKAIGNLAENNSSRHMVFVDTTASETAPLVLESLKNGFHIVLANKKPLAVDQEMYDEMFRLAKDKKLMLRYEATVGAGLPVLDTLDKLEGAGDSVESILGCFSGTLGYILTQVEDGLPYSEAVRKAYENGYTEPDPRDDLSGMDVARKTLILARRLGHRVNLSDMHIESLFTDECNVDDPQEFLQKIEMLDEPFAERLKVASSKNMVLRYVGRIEGNNVRVSIEEVPEQSALGRLRGTNNQVTIQTKRYHRDPLIVTGPGAGAQVTAAGVLNDLVAIATAYKRD